MAACKTVSDTFLPNGPPSPRVPLHPYTTRRSKGTPDSLCQINAVNFVYRAAIKHRLIILDPGSGAGMTTDLIIHGSRLGGRDDS